MSSLCRVARLSHRNHLPLEVFQARPTGRRPWGRLRTCWRDNLTHLAWEHFRISQEELECIVGERDMDGQTDSTTTPHNQAKAFCH